MLCVTLSSAGSFRGASVSLKTLRFLGYRGFGGKVHVDRSQVFIVLTVKRGRTTSTSIFWFVSILSPSVARPSEVEENGLEDIEELEDEVELSDKEEESLS